MKGIFMLLGQALGLVKTISVDGKDKAEIKKQKLATFSNPITFVLVVFCLFIIAGQVFNLQISDWFYHIFEKVLDYCMDLSRGLL